MLIIMQVLLITLSARHCWGLSIYFRKKDVHENVSGEHFPVELKLRSCRRHNCRCTDTL